jgi:S-methylmethionine-dependent homocysteine/selenocysteine methylase
MTTPYNRLKWRLDEGGIVLLDGPTGTELQRRGVAMDKAAWCGPATLEHADLLTQIHADYIAAGAVITANTYASSRLMLSDAGLADRLDELVRCAVDAAYLARERAPRGGRW